MAKKERLIELLQEKRTALITHAVTKGLDPNVPMKPSGIDWFGDIPEHWKVLRLRRVVDRFIDYRGRTPTKIAQGVPLITAGAIRDGTIDHSRVPEYIAEEDYEAWMKRGLPRRGDVVITTEAPLGEVAPVTDTRVAFAQRVILFRLNSHRVTNEYLVNFYQSKAGRRELESRASGSTASGIRADRLRASQIPVPPLEEQRATSVWIANKLALHYALLAALGRHIALLSEYRTALISAAVTGKIDVRGEVG